MTITNQIIQKLEHDSSLTDLQFFALELAERKTSAARSEMILGEKYYSGNHDIVRRLRTAIGKNGKLEPLHNVVNNHIIDNQYSKHVDQKKNYILGKPLTFSAENDGYISAVKQVLGRKFMRTLKNTICDALNGAIAWLYPYYDKDGKLEFKSFKPYEILPFWSDSAHCLLDCAARLYQVEVYKGSHKEVVEMVDTFQSDGVSSYIWEHGTLLPTAKKRSYITAVDQNGAEQSYNWERIPLIPIKYNAAEIPLIRRIKPLQDAINLILSDFVNNMEEDVRSTVLILKNLDGTDLSDFRHNLTAYGAIKIRDSNQLAGGVDTLKIEVNSNNYKVILDLLKKALIENARSYDGKDDRLSGAPNQMNIQSMYSDIDLDANDMETELQAAFEDILWFVNKYLQNSGMGDFGGEEITVTFNRDMLINESEAIANCVKSVGIISSETIVAQHPWTTDVVHELERVRAEEAEQQEYAEAFAADQKGGAAGEK